MIGLRLRSAGQQQGGRYHQDRERDQNPHPRSPRNQFRLALSREASAEPQFNKFLTNSSGFSCPTARTVHVCGQRAQSIPSAHSQQKKRANYVGYIVSGVLHSWLRLSFVLLIPVDLRGKAQRPLPQIACSEERDESTGRSAIFGGFAQKHLGRGPASPEYAPANRSGRGQASWPIR